jgi:hypothetical protein
MDGTECLGRWAGVTEHVGDELTYTAVNEITHQAIFRSDIRTATDPNAPNFRAEVIHGMTIQPSAPKDEGSMSIFPAFRDEPPATQKVYPVTPEELIGKTIMREDKDGSIVRTEVVWMLKKDASDTQKQIKFLVETKNGEASAEDIMEYNELCDIVEHQLDAIENNALGGLQTFDRILAHKGPLSVKNPKYKEPSYNLLIEWANEEPTWEPLNIIVADDKVSVALYGKSNGLLEKKGWRCLKKTAKNLRKVYSCV